MKLDEFYCFRCKKPVKGRDLKANSSSKNKKRLVRMLKGSCSQCQGKLSKIVNEEVYQSSRFI